MKEVAIALVSGFFGAGLTKILDWKRSEKADRERWENNLRGAYGVFLNLLYEYPKVDGFDKWNERYKHEHARTLLSGSAAVAALLVREPLDMPPDRRGERLLSPESYAELVDAMRKDVAPVLKKPRRWLRRRDPATPSGRDPLVPAAS